MKLPVAIAAGFAAGIIFVATFLHIQSAKAGPPDCAVWEIAGLPPFTALPASTIWYTDASGKLQPMTAFELPAGWEPMSPSLGSSYMRRCKP